MRKLFMIVLSLVIIAILGVFTVDIRQNAIVENQLFNSTKVYKHGVYFTLPFVSKVVYVYMNQRVMNYEVQNGAYNYTFMVKWQVVDPLKYYHNLDAKTDTLKQIESIATTSIISQHDLAYMVHGNNLLQQNIMVESLGLSVQDIRLIAYAHVESAPLLLQKESMIISNDVQYLESSYYLAQKIKTEADVEASKLYVPLQKADPRFYDYYRLLEVYKKSAKSKKDVPPINEIYR